MPGNSKPRKQPPQKKAPVTHVMKASDVFHVSFDTESRPGYVTAVKVTLSEDIVMDDETVSVALADHPLYKKLEAYVLANPSSARD